MMDAPALFSGLQRLGRSAVDRGAPPTLGGNFALEAAEPVGAPDLDLELDALAAVASPTLQFLSPLGLERPAALKVKGAGYLNGDCFPPGHFLNRLAGRHRRRPPVEVVPLADGHPTHTAPTRPLRVSSHL